MNTYCNFACKYCSQASPNQGETLNKEYADTFVDFFSASARPETRVTLIGGEPTLHPDFFRIVEKIESKMNLPNVVLLTNGALSERFLKRAINRTKIKFYIPFEGLPEIHDSERILPNGKGTSAHVLRAIEKISRAAPERLQVRINYSTLKFGREKEIANFFSSVGIPYVMPGIMIPEGRGASYKNLDFKKALERWPLFIKALDEAGVKRSPTLYNKNEWASCRPGEKAFFLTVDGKIAGCQNILDSRKTTEFEKKFIIGEISNHTVKTFSEKINQLVEFSSKIPASCASCDFITYCHGCPMKRNIPKNGKYIFDPDWCRQNQMMFCSLARHGFLEDAKVKKACGELF